MSAPIEEKHKSTMNQVADSLNKIFEGHGFALLVFNLNSHDGRINYVSNARREDMLVAMREFIARFEGRVIETDQVQ